MTLQINYQPSAILLGEMATAAGKSEYNRWLQGFNQQKAQTIANAFMGGFTQMGLPMMQMRSRENLMKQQIAARGQASATRSMQSLEWKRNNMPLLRDMTADRMHARYGPQWAEDPVLLEEWQQTVANMDAGDARDAVNKWMFHRNQDRSHGIAFSPSSQNARASGNYEDARISSQVEPKFAKAIASIEKGPYKPEVKRQMISALNRQMSRQRNPAGRPRTKFERYDSDVMVERIPGTDVTRISTFNRKTESWDHVYRDKFEEDKKTLDDLYSQYDKLTRPPTNIAGDLMELNPEQKRYRTERANVIRKRIRFYENRIHPGMHKDAEQTDADDDRISQRQRFGEWAQRPSPNGSVRGNQGELLDSHRRSGRMETMMQHIGVDREEDIPPNVWKELGFDSPPPHIVPSSVSEQQKDTERKASAAARSQSPLERYRSEHPAPQTDEEWERWETESTNRLAESLSDSPSSRGERPPSLAELSFDAGQRGHMNIGGQQVNVMGWTRSEIEGTIAASGRDLPDPSSYVFEDGQLRKLSGPELRVVRQRQAVQGEKFAQQKALDEQNASLQRIVDREAQDAYMKLHPSWRQGQPVPPGWVKMQSSGSRAEGTPVREWIVPSPRLMETFRELKANNQTEMSQKYGRDIHEMKKKVKSKDSKRGLDRLGKLWQQYVAWHWKSPSRGIPGEDAGREGAIRMGSAAAIYLSYMKSDPQQVIQKFLQYTRNPQGPMPEEIKEIATAYRVLQEAGVFKKEEKSRDYGSSTIRPGM